MIERFVSKVDFDSYDDFYKNFKINVPENFNFAYDVVDKIAEENPGKIALVWCNDKGEEATFTFADIKRESDKAANVFRSLGIRKGDPVMLILKRHYEYWFYLLALHKLGAVAIPSTHMLKCMDIEFRNQAADVKMIVSVNDADVLDEIDAAVPKSPSLKVRAVVKGDREGWVNITEECAKASEVFVAPQGEEATTNEDRMLLYFTSGTTGMCKMVAHNFTYPLGHIVTAKYWHNVQENGLHLTVADTGWAKAAWGKIYGQWIAGTAIFVYDYDVFNPPHLLEAISKHGVTTFCAPPTIYRFLIKEDLSKYDLSKLKYCTTAGEPFNPKDYERFLQMTGIKLMESYGQTELTVTTGTFSFMEPKPGSIGKPSPGYDIDLLNDKGESCGVGEEGQIVVRTDKGKPLGMFDGYYRAPKRTQEVWCDDIYYTGDMAMRDEDGYFWFVGRADDVIKSSGYRIGPFEVESALLEHPAVSECVVIGVPDLERGQIVKALIILAPGYEASDELVVELQEYVKTITAPYKYPREIEFVDTLPKTISGKVRRVELRDKH